MDVQQTWNDLLSAWCDRDWSQVQDAAESIMQWLDRKGFAPETAGSRHVGNEWNRTVALAASRYAAGVARSVLEAPNGIPDGVPFSVSCCDCDATSPASYEEAVEEGWTGIEFFPQGIGENFLGQCPQHSEER